MNWKCRFSFCAKKVSDRNFVANRQKNKSFRQLLTEIFSFEVHRLWIRNSFFSHMFFVSPINAQVKSKYYNKISGWNSSFLHFRKENVSPNTRHFIYTNWFKDFWVIWKIRRSRLDLMSFVYLCLFFAFIYFSVVYHCRLKKVQIWICHSYNRKKDEKRRHKCSKVLKYQHIPILRSQE